MESRLDPIFRTQLRLTEELDTRQAIQREEQRGRKRKHGDKKDEEGDSDLWDDSTSVSVPALKAILQDFIQPKAPTDSEPPDKDKATISEKQQKPESARAAHATQAYQHGAEINHTKDAAQPGQETPSAAMPELSVKEQRTIHRLINDLEMLETKEIHEIVIKLSGDFLQSIIRAIEAEKAGIGL